MKARVIWTVKGNAYQRVMDIACVLMFLNMQKFKAYEAHENESGNRVVEFKNPYGEKGSIEILSE